MLTNPAPTTSAAQVGDNRPSLRIAARSTPDPHEAEPAAAVLIPHEVAQWQAQWRRTLDTVKATLAGLEQACESAIDARETEVTGLIDTLVQAAAADATTAVEQTREQAEIEIRELQQISVTLQTRVDTLQVATDAERENVKRLAAQLDNEAAARVRAETERGDLQRLYEGCVAAAELQAEALRLEIQAGNAELARARQQLEAAAAERSKLTTTFRLVQRALALSTPEDLPVPAQAEGDAFIRPEAGAHQRPAERSVVPETPAEAPNAGAEAQRAFIDAHPEAAADITRVLEQVGNMYQQDVVSGCSGIESVDRLTAMLRHAGSLIETRWTDDFDARALFRYQVDLLLEREAATSFGRHLSIAVYASRTPPPSPAPASETAQGSGLETFATERGALLLSSHDNRVE
jgi:chaperonin cofactor prefoldin